MPSLSARILLIATAAAVMLAAAAPADAAKARKSKKHVAHPVARVQPIHRGTQLFPPGPLYFSGVYLGDDPDPNIRFQPWRDISGRLGGEP
jgi:hypothetical protein